MDWIFVISVVLCLLYISGPQFADAYKSVHRPIIDHVTPSLHSSSIPVSRGSTRKEKKNVVGHVKHSSNFVRPSIRKKLKNDVGHSPNFVRPSIREKLKNDAKLMKTRTFPVPSYGYEKSKRNANVTGVLQHLSQETQFLRKKTTVNATLTTIPTLIPPTVSGIEFAEELNSELTLASTLEKEEDKILKDLQNSTDLENSHQKRAVNPFLYGKDYMAYKVLQLGRQKREINPHEYDKNKRDINNILNDGRSKRRTPKNRRDKYARSIFLQKLFDDDTDYDSELQDNRSKEQVAWFDKFLKKRSNPKRKRKKNSKPKNQDMENDKKEDTDDEDDDDDNDDDENDDDDNDDDDENDDDDNDEDEEDDNDDAEEDAKSMQKLSDQTKFLHKPESETKAGNGKIGMPLDRLKELMKKLDTSKIQEKEDIDDDDDDDDDDEPVKSSKIFKEYQEPYIPPAESTESSIIANAVLWIGVGVGTAFSAIMFMLCCSFYRCLTYYRTHLSTPLKSFLESYEDKNKRPTPKKPSPRTDEDSQYIISISDKKEDGLDWSSDEEEVFDISSAVKMTSKE